MTAPAATTSQNYKKGLERQKQLQKEIREQNSKKLAVESKPFVPVLMPKLGADGRPVFDRSTTADLYDLCPLEQLPPHTPIRMPTSERNARATND